jgi:HlyD family secretion protein
VFAIEQDKAHQRQIVIGHRSDREAEVRQGLNQGETVILHPTEQIKEGIQVTSR